ncbi:NACHT domain-containing protein [Sessilibacter corallicola]|uniref:NACHT domain-containing protein n=1 Tax=Sessilibacter corallicola TaxID=2904075 RepID=A0ABQ0ACX3_9GAMM
MTKLIETTTNTLAKTASADIYAFVKEWFKKIDPRGEKSKAYIQGIHRTCNEVQIMGMARPRKISTIYISLRAYPELRKYINKGPKKDDLMDLETIVDIDGGKEVFDIESAIKSLGYSSILSSGFDNFSDVNALDTFASAEKEELTEKNIQGVNVFTYVNANEKVVVLGQPGSGKTTFLKSLALLYGGLLKLEVDFIFEPKMPIYIRLRDYSGFENPNSDLDWFMKVAIDSVASISSEEIGDWIKNQIGLGNCIFLVDGLDELPKEKLKSTVLSYRKFVTAFSGNKYITTCRTASYDFGLEGFRFCEVDDFTGSEIDAFVNQWFEGDERSKQIKKDMQCSRHSEDLMKTPLLATLVCIMYEKNRTLPNNRSELYESCIDALIHMWDTHRLIERSGKIKDISAKQAKYLLAEISRSGFEQNKILIEKNSLLRYIKDEIEKLGLKITAEDMLYDYERNMGIIIERTPDVFCFSHLTIQEYFAAISYSESRQEVKLAELAFSDPRYKEVFLLCLERMYVSDEPIIKLCGMIKNTYISQGESSSYLLALLSEISNSQANYTKKTKILVRLISGDLMAADIY